MTEKLAKEMFRRFPELRDYSSDGDEELPYLLMSYLVRWLQDQSKQMLSKGVLGRVKEFESWCKEQPRTKDAATDIFTILYVGFYEELLQIKNLHKLIPEFISKEEMLDNREYLITWVGEENYNHAMQLYSPRKITNKK